MVQSIQKVQQKLAIIMISTGEDGFDLRKEMKLVTSFNIQTIQIYGIQIKANSISNIIQHRKFQRICLIVKALTSFLDIHGKKIKMIRRKVPDYNHDGALSTNSKLL